MAALTKKRMARVKKASMMDLPVGAAVKIFQGAYVVFDGGYIVPASTDTSLTPVGRADADADNSLGLAGAMTVRVDFMKEKTFFPFIASAAFVQTDMGTHAYLSSDQNVTPVATGATAAGIAYKHETAGAIQTVWVEV